MYKYVKGLGAIWVGATNPPASSINTIWLKLDYKRPKDPMQLLIFNIEKGDWVSVVSHTSSLVNDGDGKSPFATLEDIVQNSNDFKEYIDTGLNKLDDRIDSVVSNEDIKLKELNNKVGDIDTRVAKLIKSIQYDENTSTWTITLDDDTVTTFEQSTILGGRYDTVTDSLILETGSGNISISMASLAYTPVDSDTTTVAVDDTDRTIKINVKDYISKTEVNQKFAEKVNLNMFAEYRWAVGTLEQYPTPFNSTQRYPGGTDTNTWVTAPPTISNYDTQVLYMTVGYVREDNSLAVDWTIPIRVTGINGTDGLNGNNGDWVSYAFKQSINQPDTPTGTSIIPTGWVDAPTGNGVWWMSKALISGDTKQAITAWSVPIKAVGEDGQPGADGNYTDFKYAKNTSTTAAPAIVVTDLNPTGWTDTPPALGSNEYLWMSQSVKNGNGTALVKQWSTPVRISGENGAAGSPGVAISMTLVNEVYTFSTSSTGDINGADLPGIPATQIIMYRGATDITSQYNFAAEATVPTIEGTFDASSPDIYRITKVKAGHITGGILITATPKTDSTLPVLGKLFTITRIQNGQDGSSVTSSSQWLVSDVSTIAKVLDPNGDGNTNDTTFNPNVINITALKQVGTGVPAQDNTVYVNVYKVLNNGTKTLISGAQGKVSITLNSAYVDAIGLYAQLNMGISESTPILDSQFIPIQTVMDYIALALQKGDTTIAGGLVLSNIIAVRDIGSNNIRAGLSGLSSDKVYLFANKTDAYTAAINYMNGTSKDCMFAVGDDGIGKWGIMEIGENLVTITDPKTGYVTQFTSESLPSLSEITGGTSASSTTTVPSTDKTWNWTDKPRESSGDDEIYWDGPTVTTNAVGQFSLDGMTIGIYADQRFNQYTDNIATQFDITLIDATDTFVYLRASVPIDDWDLPNIGREIAVNVKSTYVPAGTYKIRFRLIVSWLDNPDNTSFHIWTHSGTGTLRWNKLIQQALYSPTGLAVVSSADDYFYFNSKDAHAFLMAGGTGFYITRNGPQIKRTKGGTWEKL